MKKQDSTKNQLLSPYSTDAFAPETVKKVVFSKVSFEISDDLWEEFDNVFQFYWNEEVGYGNYADYYEACHYISWQLY